MNRLDQVVEYKNFKYADRTHEARLSFESLMAGESPTSNSESGGGYKPDMCFNDYFTGDVADLKEGRYVTYVTEYRGRKTTTKTTVVGKDADNWCVEEWTEGDKSYGLLMCVAADGKVVKAYAAAKGDKKWTEIKVNGSLFPDFPKPKMTVTDDTKEVKAGKFACKKVTVNPGRTFETYSWFSSEVWKLRDKYEYGGLVAIEWPEDKSKMWLEAKGEDGRATIEVKKK